MDIQLVHTPQGSGFERLIFSQLTILDIILAIVVLPTPLVPEKRKAWGSLLSLIEPLIILQVSS